MKNNLFKGILILLVPLFLTLLLAACGTNGGSFGVIWGKGEGSKAPKEYKKGGPPSHAPAHGYRAKHHYRYYPSCSVYYDTGKEVYFYLEGDNWRISASLPNHLRINLGDFVSIELDTTKPYMYHHEHKAKYPHAEHVKKYPPGQLKKKKHKKFVKH